MNLDALAPLASLYISFCALWICAAGIADQFRASVYRPRRAAEPKQSATNAYELIRRVG